MYHVTKDGWKKVSGTDVGELHFEYYPKPVRTATAAYACGIALHHAIWPFKCHPYKSCAVHPSVSLESELHVVQGDHPTWGTDPLGPNT